MPVVVQCHQPLVQQRGQRRVSLMRILLENTSFECPVGDLPASDTTIGRAGEEVYDSRFFGSHST